MKETKLYSRLVYSGRILDLYKDNVVLADGREAVREVVKHNEAVCILPLELGNIILVKQFRYSINRELLEIPAGLMEQGETPEEAARRELREETGYTAEKITKLFSFFSSPGFTNEKLHLFKAEGLIAGEQEQDPDEAIDIVRIKGGELHDKLFNGEIEDSKTILAILYYLGMR